MWCISYDQLMAVEAEASRKFGAEYHTKTMRDVTEHIIAPVCQESGKCYATSLNPKGLPIDVFVTHSWDEPFAEFVQSLREALHGDCPNLWICSFALPQGDSEAIGSMLNVPLASAPFTVALSWASTFVVARNTHTDVYSRIWCVCELLYAKKYGLVPHKTRVVGPDCFRGSQSSCLDASATSSEDRERIIQELVANARDVYEIDSFIRVFRNL